VQKSGVFENKYFVGKGATMDFSVVGCDINGGKNPDITLSQVP